MRIRWARPNGTRDAGAFSNAVAVMLGFRWNFMAFPSFAFC
jgi:hypothetical protein